MDTLTAREIKANVAYAATNAENLSQAEPEAVLSQAREFVQSLPEEKRGAFYWNCRGLECLSMLANAPKDAV